MSSDLRPWTPAFAPQLDPRLVQFHSHGYRCPTQLQDGDVLIVGAGNSGADIAMEVAQQHTTLLSKRDVGHVPFPINRITAATAYHVVRFGFHHVLKANTRRGRGLKRNLAEGHGLPLVRVKPKQLARAGVRRVPRTVGVRDGLPLLEDGRVADVTNVIWCTGFRPDFSWIDLAIFDEDREPRHTRGIVDVEPGLFFVGLDFLHSASSAQINGVGRDACHVVKDIAARRADARTSRALAGTATR
jgi:putative flavoprotein involved in K+ transport